MGSHVTEGKTRSSHPFPKVRSCIDYNLPSFQEYALIEQETPHIEHFTRQPDERWILSETHSIEHTIELVPISCTLSLTEVHDNIRW